MIELIGIAGLGFFISEWFQPIQWFKNKFKLYNYWITKHLYCVKCTSFWLGLLLTFNVYEAIIVSILGYTISFLVDLMEKQRYL
jgi:hypothetical protein